MLPDALLNPLLDLRMGICRWTHWNRLLEYAGNPRLTQQRLLLDLVHRNRDTRFGRQYGFAGIDSYESFANGVPIQTYETLRPFVEEQERSGEPALTAARPVLYALTSGTTGQPKRIPILEETLRQLRWSQAIQVYAQYRTDPDAFHGRLLAIVSPAVEGHLESGAPYGSTSGHLYRNMPALAKAKYVLPAEVFDIHDYELKYLTILRLALAADDITFMAAANPSTFLKLLAVLRGRRTELLEDLACGAFRHANELPPGVRESIVPRLRCSADRLRRLTNILAAGELDFAKLWPRLRLVVTWMGGSCGIALAALRPLLLPSTRVSETGYLSSEFRGTITVDPEQNLGLPTIYENFFEFAERDAWDAGRQAFLTIERLEKDREYYVIVTTRAGLYRYFMNDIVKVTGSFRATPTLQFVQKGKGVTNITGEKLYENQVIQAVRAVEVQYGRASPFFLMLAVPNRAIYRLIYEMPSSLGGPDEMAQRIDQRLGSLNVEYEQKRASGRLGPLEMIAVAPGAGEAYKKHLLGRGQREGQFKTVSLLYEDDCSFPFEDFRGGT